MAQEHYHWPCTSVSSCKLIIAAAKYLNICDKIYDVKQQQCQKKLVQCVQLVQCLTVK